MTAEIAVEQKRGGWRSRLPWVLLVLSLVLNLFFVGGALWLKEQASRARMAPAERVQFVADELSLNPDQRAAFNQFIRTARQRIHHLREVNTPLVEQAWSEFAKPTPDQAQIDRLFAESADNRRQYQVEMGQALRVFLGTLSEEQRNTFIDLARNRQNRAVPPFLRRLVE